MLYYRLADLCFDDGHKETALVYFDYMTDLKIEKAVDLKNVVDRTSNVIRQLKSNDWEECFISDDVTEYLLEYDPTCFRRVENIIYVNPEDS